MFDKSKNELLAEQWFMDNGYGFKLEKQYVSKTVYTVQKDGLTDKFELPSEVSDMDKYMELYRKNFDMMKKLK